jgi:hypothetical protein
LFVGDGVAGGVQLVTVSATVLLVADPALFVATHRNCRPLKLLGAALIVNIPVVTPLYGPASVRSVNMEPPFVDICH